MMLSLAPLLQSARTSLTRPLQRLWERVPDSVLGVERGRLAVGLVLGLVVLGHLVVLGLWIPMEQEFAHPVCVGMNLPMSDSLQLIAAGAWQRAVMDHLPGLFIWPALGLHRLIGPDPHVLLWSNMVLVALSLFLAFDLGRLVGGATVGVLSAALLFLVPDVAMIARRWSSMMFQMLMVLLAANLLLRSRSFTRFLPTAGFALAGSVGMCAGFHSTDNIAWLAALGAMVLGAGLRGLLLGRGLDATQLAPRWKVLLLGAAVGAALAWVFVRWEVVDASSLDYIGGELQKPEFVEQAPRFSLQALTAYLRLMWYSMLSPWLALPFLVALVPWLQRGKARAELGFWLVIPVVFFSLIAKKNGYYIYFTIPAVVLITAQGLVLLRRWHLGALVACFALTAGTLQLLERSFTARRWPLENVFGPYRMPFDASEVLETVISPQISPMPVFRHEREVELILPHLSGSRCEVPIQPRILVLHPGDYQDFRLKLALSSPCLGNVLTWPALEQAHMARWVVVGDPECQPGAPVTGHLALDPDIPWAGATEHLLQRPGSRHVASDMSDRPCLHLYRTTDHGLPWP